ncbi:MAG: EI24 domain-containing protein [Campylobacterota bacterium]|nr:EI24 domain-containing protein [Campylobacterota bacterium]
MLDINILKLSIKDYFTKDMLKLIIYPLIGSVLVMYFLFFSIASSGLDSLEQTQIQIQTHQTMVENGNINEETTTEIYTGNSIFDFLLKYTVTSWIVSFLVYTVGLFAMGYLSIFISLIVVGFLTPKILSIIHKRHYSSLALDYGYESIFGSVFFLLKSAFIMIVLFIFLIPLFFIPFINIIAINLPFYYFFHKMLNYDVSSNIMPKDKFKKLYYINKTNLRAKTLLLYTVSLIPFVAFFIAIFYIIYIGHSYYKLLEEDKY